MVTPSVFVTADFIEGVKVYSMVSETRTIDHVQTLWPFRSTDIAPSHAHKGISNYVY